jgi:hypothetical protein
MNGLPHGGTGLIPVPVRIIFLGKTESGPGTPPARSAVGGKFCRPERIPAQWVNVSDRVPQDPQYLVPGSQFANPQTP